MNHCKFRTSHGGVQFCEDPVYLEGFCKFHHKAYRAGEINELGVINELLSDQVRRREINFHGCTLSSAVYVEDER